jgi:sec-independent protein translocase protein TatC
MPFLEHLAELRRRLVIIAAVILVGSSTLYFWAPQLYDLVMKPITELPQLGGKPLNILGPFGTFGLRFSVGLYGSIVLGSPIILWQVLAFFLPALKPKERKYVIPTFIALVIFFASGVAFCYAFILKTAFGWMVSQAWQTVQVLPDAKLYFSGATLLMLGFGIAFELPVVLFYLMVFNVVPYRTLRKNWRVAYLILMVVASIATPDWSPVTMGALFGALLVLYEGSMALARVVLTRRIAQQKALYGDIET